MANKKRLIDADEFAKMLEKTDANVCADYGDGLCEFGYSRLLLRLLLSESPTVDAVEVVRCRQCKSYDEECGYCESMGFTCKFDDFCSYGEKRINGKAD